MMDTAATALQDFHTLRIPMIVTGIPTNRAKSVTINWNSRSRWIGTPVTIVWNGGHDASEYATQKNSKNP